MSYLNFKVQFREGWDYVKKTRNYIYSIIILFFAFMIIGFVFSNYLTFFDEVLKRLVYRVKDLNSVETIFFILQNNLQTALLGMIFGIVFGVFSIFSAATNGLAIGYVLAKVYEVSGLGDFWRLLPHGIFELPAIFIALGLGLRLGAFFFERKKERLGEKFGERFYKSINSFLMIVVPLLIIAALIEGILIMAYK